MGLIKQDNLLEYDSNELLTLARNAKASQNQMLHDTGVLVMSYLVYYLDLHRVSIPEVLQPHVNLLFDYDKNPTSYSKGKVDPKNCERVR